MALEIMTTPGEGVICPYCRQVEDLELASGVWLVVCSTCERVFSVEPLPDGGCGTRETGRCPRCDRIVLMGAVSPIAAAHQRAPGVYCEGSGVLITKMTGAQARPVRT